jgi:hypothetical protein
MKRVTKSFQKAITLDGMHNVSLPLPIKLKQVADGDADDTVLPDMLAANDGIHPHVTKIHRFLHKLAHDMHTRGSEWGDFLQDLQTVNEQLHHGVTTAVEKHTARKYPPLWVGGVVASLFFVFFTLVVGRCFVAHSGPQ